MTPYVVASGTFQAYHLVAWEEARALVAMVRDRGVIDCKAVRCHELARAVLAELPNALVKGKDNIDVVDGRCGPTEHSWLQFMRSGHILDVYRPGVMPCVLLVDSFLAMRDYRIVCQRTDIRAPMLERLRKEMRG